MVESSSTRLFGPPRTSGGTKVTVKLGGRTGGYGSSPSGAATKADVQASTEKLQDFYAARRSGYTGTFEQYKQIETDVRQAVISDIQKQQKQNLATQTRQAVIYDIETQKGELAQNQAANKYVRGVYDRLGGKETIARSVATTLNPYERTVKDAYKLAGQDIVTTLTPQPKIAPTYKREVYKLKPVPKFYSEAGKALTSQLTITATGTGEQFRTPDLRPTKATTSQIGSAYSDFFRVVPEGKGTAFKIPTNITKTESKTNVIGQQLTSQFNYQPPTGGDRFKLSSLKPTKATTSQIGSAYSDFFRVVPEGKGTALPIVYRPENRATVRGVGETMFAPLSTPVLARGNFGFSSTQNKDYGVMGQGVATFLSVRPGERAYSSALKRQSDLPPLFLYREPTFMSGPTIYESSEPKRERVESFVMGGLTEIEQRPGRAAAIFGASVLAPQVFGAIGTAVGIGTSSLATTTSTVAGVGLLGYTGYNVGTRIKSSENPWYTAGSIFAGELAPAFTGYYVGSRVVPKLIDSYRTFGMKEIKQASLDTKPFYKPSEAGGRYVFYERYEGFKITEPKSWVQTFQGFKPGQFTQRTYRPIAPEVGGFFEGKKVVSFWDVTKSGDIKYVTKSTTMFPYAAKSEQLNFFQSIQQKLYYLPGQTTQTPAGVSATPFTWGTGEVILEPGGQYFSGKGISVAFTRLRSPEYFSTQLFGTKTVYPEVQQTFFDKVIKKPAAFERTIYSNGARLKQYVFKSGETAATLPQGPTGYLPLYKPEVEAIVAGGTASNRAATGQFVKILGRNVPFVESTFTASGVTPGATTVVKGLSTSSSSIAASTLPVITPTTFLYSAVSSEKVKPYSAPSQIKPSSITQNIISSKISTPKVSSPVLSSRASTPVSSILSRPSESTSSITYSISPSIPSPSSKPRPSSSSIVSSLSPSSIFNRSSYSRPSYSSSSSFRRPTFGNIKIPSLSGKSFTSKPIFKFSSFKPKYTPSLKASVFKIKGKKPKQEELRTGLFTRPLLRGL